MEFQTPAAVAALQSYFTHSDEHLRLARQMWWMGCAGLPLLWLLNWANLRKVAAEPEATRELKLLVRVSLGGAVLAGAALLAWLLHFQNVKDSLVCPCDTPFGSDLRQRAPPVTL